MCSSDLSARAALILSIGHYPKDVFAQKDFHAKRSVMADIYRDDVDPSVHGATAWLLRHWEAQDEIKACDEKLSTGKIEDSRRWYLTHFGHTMTVITGPVEFAMGSPANDAHAATWNGETQHRVTIKHSFAIDTTEMTREQWRQFEPTYPELSERRCPANYVPWYLAVKYCRWLSEREKIPESEMCYPPADQIGPGMRLPENYLERTGYRLPTEAEWEYACRSGSTTIRFFGTSLELLPRYAWYIKNSNEQVWPVGTLMPNDFGLFDVYGNVLEWCQDAFVADYTRPPEEKALNRIVKANDERILRGGSFTHIGPVTRSADRSWIAPDNHTVRTGFRIARTLAKP